MKIQESNEFKSWFQQTNELVSNNSDRELDFEIAKTYIKVWAYIKALKGKDFQGKSIYAFVDDSGNIYKPASYKAPAKGIRGNVYNDDNGMNCVGVYSIQYFR